MKNAGFFVDPADFRKNNPPRQRADPSSWRPLITLLRGVFLVISTYRLFGRHQQFTGGFDATFQRDLTTYELVAHLKHFLD